VPVINTIHIQGVSPKPSIAKWVEPGECVTLHGVVTYTVVMSNTGVLPAQTLHMTDTPPSEVEFGEWIESY